MTRIVEFFVVSQPPPRPHREWVKENLWVTLEEDPNINQVQKNQINTSQANIPNQGVAIEHPRVEPLRREPQIPRETEPRIVMVNRNQNDDEVIHQVRHDDMAAYNNLTAMVERIMAQNGLNVGLHKPTYTSPLNEYILQSYVPHRWKVSECTKFYRDTTESTIEHMDRYIIEASKIASNENLRIKYFPSSLTKNAFTWFTTLPASSIHNWAQLERLFHEQFYMGHTKISLKELASVKCEFTEPIDDYLNRFLLCKAKCFTQVLENELVFYRN
ncbi:uncharacterized protein LOC131619301 [Vicia villosa]|uniref:uncharacterized protein LOC131619301 n=1 Tax=Vicia villosa TaxID=3911 RepID=UPI00273B15B4|nr:uncharacterized protein LOC131619301 [Vicia villosa]